MPIRFKVTEKTQPDIAGGGVRKLYASTNVMEMRRFD